MHYYALISSFPVVTLDSDSGMTADNFLSACQAYIKGDDLRTLEELSLDPSPEKFESGSFARKYASWEASLRNAAARARSARLGIDPTAYLDREAEVEADTERAVNSAWAAADPLERERILDRARWTKIEELEAGKPFSFEQVCAFKLKLLLRQKWADRQNGDPENNLEQALTAVSSADVKE